MCKAGEKKFRYLRDRASVPILSLPSRALIISTRIGETNRVSRPRRSGAATCRAGGWSAIQPTCSARTDETDGRKPSVDRSRSSRGYTVNAQLCGRRGKENGEVNSPTPGSQCVGRPASLFGGVRVACFCVRQPFSRRAFEKYAAVWPYLLRPFRGNIQSPHRRISRQGRLSSPDQGPTNVGPAPRPLRQGAAHRYL